MENFVAKIKQNPKVTIASIVSFLIVLILVIVLAVTLSKKENATEDYYSNKYFQDSILKQIRKEKVPFEATIHVYNAKEENGKIKKDIMNVIKDSYSSEYTNGKQTLDYYENGKKIWTDDLLYKGLDEIYLINYDLKTCDSFDFSTGKTWVEFYLGNWMPREVLDAKKSSIIISPSYLLYYIFEEYRGYPADVKCAKKEKDAENKEDLVKCELVRNETIKIEYFFDEKDGKTMYPKTISIFKRRASKDKWNLYRVMDYSDFKVKKNEELLDMFLTLPIGLGCERKNEKSYTRLYRLKSPFTPEFYFDYDLSFKYADEKSKEIVFKKYSGSMHRFKMNVDLDVNVNLGVNEETNKEMNTFYDKETKMFYDFYPEDVLNDEVGKCERHSYENSKNWFYFPDIFINNRDMFDFAENSKIQFSFLGVYTVDGIKAFVYEAMIGDFKKLAKEVYGLANQEGHSKNMNNVSADHMYATYYYHTNLKDNFEYYDLLTMPFKMEFRLKENSEIIEEEENMITLDIKKYKSFMSHDIINPFKNCIKKSLGYDHVNITYTADKKELQNLLIDLKESAKNKLREKIDTIVSALRVNEFEVKVNESTGDKDISEIYISFKLFDPIDAEINFDIIEGKEFEYTDDDDVKIWSNFNEEQCAIECLQEIDCGTFSHDQETLICKMFMIKNFNNILYANKGKIDFSDYYKTVEKEGNKLGQKKQFFFCEKHCSNLEHIGTFGKKFQEKFLDLELLKNDMKFYTIKPKKFSAKRVNGVSE